MAHSLPESPLPSATHPYSKDILQISPTLPLKIPALGAKQATEGSGAARAAGRRAMRIVSGTISS